MKGLSKEDGFSNAETLKIETLLEIGNALSSSSNIEKAVNDIMKILAFRLAMNRGALVLLDYETKELTAEIVYGGYKQNANERDVQESVLEKGIPLAVSSLGGPPLFLDNSNSGDIRKTNISYLCIPMKIGNRVVGSLTVDRLFDDTVAFEEDLILLNNITSVITQTISISNMVKAERDALIAENKKLRQDLEKIGKLRDRDESKTCSGSRLSIEKVLEKKLDEIITVMDIKTEGKRRLYTDIISKVEKVLISLALKRTKNIKCEAARFLGINRNTLHNKIKNLGISV